MKAKKPTSTTTTAFSIDVLETMIVLRVGLLYYSLPAALNGQSSPQVTSSLVFHTQTLSHEDDGIGV